MSEQDSGWRAAVDGVVSEFDEVTRHLRVRQRQALRVAWTAVGATTVATGTLIALNLAPSSYPAALSGQTPPLALIDPAATVPAPIPGGGALLLPGVQTPPPLAPAALATDSSGPVTALAPAPHRTRAALPVTPPATVASTGPVTAVSPPPESQPPAAPAEPPGLVDGLVTGVIHLLS